MRRLVIQPHRPWRLLFEILLVVAIGALLARAWAERDGRGRLGVERSALATTAQRLEREVERLEAENEDLRDELAIQVRARQVDETANDRVSGHLRRLQQRVLELREEVAFYRGIVADDRGKGLSVQTLVIERDGGEGAYRFQLVLTRTMNGDKVATGSVSLSITGERGGRATQLSFAEMTDPAESDLPFRFKHFQRIEGRLTLPPDFLPQRVYVQVDAAGDKPSKVEKTFDWPRIAS